MDAQEIDIALDELETRLDRLRSLYEQYFLGIEKIEPGVARKDVDRRFWILRRIHIRNTARRFRLQTLIQRYNTFQQHWARICREIENGTYTRHLLRAQKNIGQEPKTWAAKKRLGYFRRKDGAENGRASQPPNAGEDLGALLDGRADLEAEAARAAKEALMLAEARASQAVHSAKPDSPISPAPSGLAKVPGPKPAPVEARRRADLEMLDLDLDDGLGPAPAAPPRAIVRPAPSPVAARPAAPIPAPPRAAAVVPVRPSLPQPKPAAATPLQPSTAPVVQPRAPEPAPEPRSPATRVPLPKPTVKAPERPPQPAGAAAPPQPRQGGASITDDRLKQIHTELAAAKRQANQSDGVSFDALSRSLRESEKKIRAQHPGKAVDFHVVMKDGKPIVKPIVRK